MLDAKTKRLFVHPAIRTYREPLYKRLGALGFSFYWTSVNEDRFHENHEVRRILSDFPYPNRRLKAWDFLPFSNVCPGVIGAFRFDTIVFSGLTSIPLQMLAFPLSLVGKATILFDELWHYPHQIRRYSVAFPYLREIARRTLGAVVVAGSRARNFYVSELGVPEERVFTAYNTTRDLMHEPVDEDARRSIRERIQALSGAQPTILYLGRLVPYKGLDTLLHALSTMRQQATLIVVGEGPFRVPCEKLAASLGLGSRVHFLGPCRSDESRYFYEAASVFALPTRFLETEPVNCESWGFTLNEAMSLEIPCVATDAVGAAFDLIRDETTGFLAHAGDAFSLSQKLDQALSMQLTRRGTMGAAARAHLNAVCSYDANLDAFCAAIASAERLKGTSSQPP